MKQFIDLKLILNNIEDLRLIEPNVFLAPFLEVIRSEETTGQITSLALSAVNKFLSYGLIGRFEFLPDTPVIVIEFRSQNTHNYHFDVIVIDLFPNLDPTHATLASTVENIADAVTHARFVGADQASDGVALMKIIQVLRTLMLSPEGSALTNESVCEVMLSCFRICFEPRLNELLRRIAEHALKDSILLLFMRLPQFAEERSVTGQIRKLKMVANGGIEQTSRRRKPIKPSNKLTVSKHPIPSRSPPIISPRNDESITKDDNPGTPNQDQLLAPSNAAILATTPSNPSGGNIVDMQGKIMQTPQNPLANEAKSGRDESVENDADVEENDCDNTKAGNLNEAAPVSKPEEPTDGQSNPVKGEDFVNSMGVRFTPQSENGASDEISK